MGIYDKKLGQEVTKEELGDLADVFTGKVRMLKITYTIQDEEGVTMDSRLMHKDYQDEDKEESSSYSNADKGENSETVMKQLNETVQDKSELELYEQIQQKEEELKELREKANHWTMQDISQGKVVPKSGITITNVKVVGFCSKCRKKYDAITRYKDGSIVPDEDINCINNAFGKCKKADKSEQEV